MNSFCFQAEDGIRDGHVTGVQTCALPISYNTLGYRVGKILTQRTSYCQYHLSYTDLVAVSHLDCRKIVPIYFQNGNVRFWIGSYALCIEFIPPSKPNTTLIPTIDHQTSRNDISISRHDHSRS